MASARRKVPTVFSYVKMSVNSIVFDYSNQDILAVKVNYHTQTVNNCHDGCRSILFSMFTAFYD